MKQRCGEFLVEQAYINGKFVSTGATFAVDDPSCDQTLANVTVVDAELTTQAIAHAKAAFKTWSKKTPKERGALVAKWGQLMLENKEKIGAVITAENGKPYGEGMGEVAYSASFCDWASHECRRVHGETMSSPWADRRIVNIKVVCRQFTGLLFLQLATDRRCRHDRPVELSRRHDCAQSRPCHCRRLYRRDQATIVDAHLGVGPGQAGRYGRHPTGCDQHCAD